MVFTHPPIHPPPIVRLKAADPVGDRKTVEELEHAVAVGVHPGRVEDGGAGKRGEVGSGADRQRRAHHRRPPHHHLKRVRDQVAEQQHRVLRVVEVVGLRK